MTFFLNAKREWTKKHMVEPNRVRVSQAIWGKVLEELPFGSHATAKHPVLYGVTFTISPKLKPEQIFFSKI